MKKQVTPSSATGSAEQNVEPVAPGDYAARFKKWFKDLDQSKAELLARYTEELLKFNTKLNLISATTIKTADSVHVADSVFASRLVAPRLHPNEPLFDIGSGNGCPGLIFAILYPQVKVVLVDRDSRKMEFCKHIVSTLGLKNVAIENRSVESLGANSLKNAISRGFAPFSRGLIVTRKQFPKGGKFFHMKSDGWANEMAGLPSQIFSHWTPSLIGEYRLPESTAQMFVVLTEKVSD